MMYLLYLDYKDLNISMENFDKNINYILDEFARFKKLNKNDIKLKTKPWINKEAQHLNSMSTKNSEMN